MEEFASLSFLNANWKSSRLQTIMLLNNQLYKGMNKTNYLQ